MDSLLGCGVSAAAREPVPRYLTSQPRVSEVAMQSAPLEQPAKRPRCDGSPRTPPSTPPATANLSADDDFQNTDLRTWEPEDVCSFLENRGFREKKVLDIFRGSGPEGRRMATVGPSRESPQGRHPKGEVSGGSGWREPAAGEGGALSGCEHTGYPRWAQVKCKPIGSLWAANLVEAQGGLVEGSFRELVTSARSDPRPS